MFAGPPEFGCALFAVGDDDQSIHAIRGAQVGNMASFEREYRVKNLIKLERNYPEKGFFKRPFLVSTTPQVRHGAPVARVGSRGFRSPEGSASPHIDYLTPYFTGRHLL